MKNSTLITGCAGFIGFHLSKKLLIKSSFKIIGVDNINNYYDIKLKKDRLKILSEYKNFIFYKIDINNQKKLNELCKKYKVDKIIHLAAQAGVRYSIDNPDIYFESNLRGFYNILELSRKNKIKHLITASTSSVYGNQKKFPLKEDFNTDKPLSFYAASKKSNEVMAYSYSNIYKIPITCLRFFTVYGPFGRPDMSLFTFTKLIKDNKKIKVFNNGDHERDFTYVDYVVDCIIALKNKSPKNKIPYEIYNISSSNPKKLNYFIKLIEKNLERKAKKILLSLQPGDVKKTHASNTKLLSAIKLNKKINIEDGVKKFINWYNNYFEK